MKRLVLGLAMVAGLFAACSPGATPSVNVVTPAPSLPASMPAGSMPAASMAASMAPSGGAGASMAAPSGLLASPSRTP